MENNPSATSGELASAGKTAMTELKRADGIQGCYSSLISLRNYDF